MKLTLTFTCIIFCTGCSLLYSTVTGIKNSRVETYDYQHHYLLKFKLDTSYMSVIKKGKEDSLANLKYSLDTYNDGSFTPIQFRVYDSNKQLYTGWEICWGSAKKKNFYSPFPQKPLSYWHINNKLSIENDLELITPLNFDEKRLRSEIEAKKYDYIVLSFWAGYLGSLSREMLHDIESAIQREPGKRFLHIKVNLSD